MASGTSREKEKEAAEGIIKSSNDEKEKQYDTILEKMSKLQHDSVTYKELFVKGCEKIFEDVLVTGDIEVRATKGEGGKLKDFADLRKDPVKMEAIQKNMLDDDPYNIYSACLKVSASSDFRASYEKELSKIENIKDKDSVDEVSKVMASQLVSHVQDQQIKQITEVVNEKSERIVRQAYFDKVHGVVETKTDDGDQTAITSYHEGLILTSMMVKGLDWRPKTVFSSTWMDILAFGDYDRMLRYIQNKSPEEIRLLLEKRETKLNYSALHHVIRGVAYLSGHIQSKSKHMECFCKLIDLGANIHARDMCGFTPLMVSCFFEKSHTHFNATLLEMANILLKHGADPNAKDRRGDTALCSPVISLNFDFVKMLLEGGADPTIPNNDGEVIECNQQAQHSTMKRLFAEARNVRTKQMRVKAKEEAGGILNKCDVCGDSSKTFRCTGCYMAIYCGKECQNLDRKNHKKLCRQISEQYVPVKLTINDLAISKRGTGQVKLVDKLQKPAKEHFVVKIQIPIGQGSSKFKVLKKVLMLNDKMMTVVGEIKENEPVYIALVDKIQAEGVFGQKGFFYAILDENKNMKINTAKILPPQVW